METIRYTFYAFRLALLIWINTQSLTLIHAENTALPFFSGTWEEILQMADQQQKLLFVYVFADYCTPCEKLEEAFTHPDLVTLHEQNYLNYKLDMTGTEHIDLAETYQIIEVPTVLYIDNQGNVLKRVVKEVRATALLTAGAMVKQDYKKVVFRAIQEHQQGKKYDNTKVTNTFAHLSTQPSAQNQRHRLYYLKEKQLPYNTFLNAYLEAQTTDFLTNEHMDFIYDFVVHVENRAIDYFLHHLPRFKERYGSQQVNNKLQEAIRNSIMTAARERNHRLLKKCIDLIYEANLPKRANFEFEMKSLYFKAIENWTAYAKVAKQYIVRHRITDPIMLNTIAWEFHQYVNNRRLLKKALKWVNQSVAIENEYYNNYTRFLLLHKLGKRKRALNACEQTIYIAQIRGKDCTAILRLKDLIMSKKQIVFPFIKTKNKFDAPFKYF